MKTKLGVIRILKLIVPYFIVVGIGQFFAFLLLGLKFTEIENLTINQHILLSSFTFLSNLLIIWVFVEQIDKQKFIAVGFQTKGRLKEFFIGFIISFIIMLIALFFVLIIDKSKIENIHFSYYKIVMTSIFLFLGAFTEELLLRGYILRNLMLSFNKYVALVVSSIVFALLHLANPNIDLLAFFDLFIGGIFLGLSYIYTKNLWFPIALHFSWNLFQSFFGFNVSGQDLYSIIELKIVHKNVLTGGDFGFEGSILSIILQAIFIVFIFFYYRKIEENTFK